MEHPIQLEIFKHLFASIAEEMGVRLQRSAYSPNIKERCDFSCAVFNPKGEMIAQAAHIPVHLGAMPLSVQACLTAMSFEPGDVAMVNDPFQGGTHLPDITLVSPVFSDGEMVGIVANRAHHADVGGMSPGSMPLSQELYQEGVIIPPLKLVSAGKLNRDVWALFLANVRTPAERSGDLQAQMAANRTGIERLLDLVSRYGWDVVERNMDALLAYSETMTRRLIQELPDGRYQFQDVLDDDGVDASPVTIAVALTIHGDEMTIDFRGTAPQRRGSVNAVLSITWSAVAYVFRCMQGMDVPANSGCLAPLHLIAPEGTVVNAMPPAAVAGGNVETSQRIVDVLLGALSQACPDRVPAASQGTMNNLAIGGWDVTRETPFAYYETLGGGMGAGPEGPGASAIHSHMTNTLNTPVEALEYAYPIRVRRYAVREGSGGVGLHSGGDGVIREMEFLQDASVTILSDRRVHPPYGMRGGAPGKRGVNRWIHKGEESVLPGKVSITVNAGDRLVIETPGGGGYGIPNARQGTVHTETGAYGDERD